MYVKSQNLFGRLIHLKRYRTIAGCDWHCGMGTCAKNLRVILDGVCFYELDQSSLYCNPSTLRHMKLVSNVTHTKTRPSIIKN